MNNFLILLFFIFLSTKVNSLLEYCAEDCKNLGFTKANLICSTCDHFNESNNLLEIRDSCLACCMKEIVQTYIRYHKAVLEVCTCKFGAYPQIEAFIKGPYSSKFKNLQIKYVRGLDPFIRLYDEEGTKVEDIDIHKWDTDSIDEYLSTYLVM